MNSKTFSFALVVTLAAALSACGGGGGGSDDTSSSSTTTGSTTTTTTTTGSTGSTGSTTTTTSSDTSLQTSAGTTTYTAGSYAATAFARVNSERLTCGFGAVTQNANLDTAAGYHSNYAMLRLDDGVATAHTEDSSLSGYTAATVADRLTLAGYAYGSASEDIDYYPLAITTDYGTHLVQNMFATVYHLASMMNGNREAGVSIATAPNAPSGYQEAVMVWENGTQSTAVQQQNTALATYPCDGSTGVQPYMLATESPEPFTNLGFTSGSGVGQPIYFQAPSGSTIVLTAGSLTAADGTVIPTTLYQYTDDANSELASNQAFIIPRANLALATTYTVVASGTINGTAFSNTTFSFTTQASW
jgi:uncharacterized protein YkwD